MEIAALGNDGATGTKDDKKKEEDQKKVSDTVIDNYGRMSAAQKSWDKGAISSFNTYLQKATDVSTQTSDLFTKAFKSMDDAVFNFATTGKLSFTDFTKSVLTDMIHIATQQATSSLLSGVVGLATKLFSNGPEAGPAATEGATIFASQFDASAGNVRFANGGAFSDSIVSKPTSFGMASGGSGLMGEAGPEAIMPLTRTSSGKLGIQAIGAGNGPGASPTVNINIASDGSSSVSGDTSGLEQFGKEMGEIAAQKYRELESRSLSSQGNIRKAINGR